MKLFELAAGDGRRFSPFCWRTRLALALKGISAEAVPVEFLDIPAICGGTGKSVPTLELDHGEVVVDSFEIARRLDELQPDKPLFRGDAAQAHCRTIEGWANAGVAMQVRNLVIVDIWAAQSPDNQTYFRDSRERRFGRTLEDLQQGREERVKPFNEVTLAPAAHALAHADWLGGAAPDYADCLLFGSLVWGPVISDFEMLQDGPVKGWLKRCCTMLEAEPEIASVLAKL